MKEMRVITHITTIARIPFPAIILAVFSVSDKTGKEVPQSRQLIELVPHEQSVRSRKGLHEIQIHPEVVERTSQKERHDIFQQSRCDPSGVVFRLLIWSASEHDDEIGGDQSFPSLIPISSTL